MPRLFRIAAALAMVAGLLPTQLISPAAATHADRSQACQEPFKADPSLHSRGYIPVAQDSPTEATTLHYQLFLPNPDLFGPGPYPAVMDYSGYQPGITIFDGLHRHFLCEGYAVIGLNIRGTGCSGGKFDYFEPRQAEDGREAFDWFAENAADLNLTGKIAMVGKSYPGITQLFLAGQPFDDDGDGVIEGARGEGERDTTPDNLVAIVPGAVFGDLYRDVPFPGGIMNVTFAAGWSAGRIYEPIFAPLGPDDPIPFSEEVKEAVTGKDERPESWPVIEGDYNAIERGDTECIANAAQHAANPPFNPFVKATYNQFDGDLFHERSPWYWADNISIPTFLFETWQDEQVGSRASNLVERFHPSLEWRFLGTNGDHGGHGDYYGRHVMNRIDEFLSFYLAEKVPAAYQGGTVTTTREVPCPEPTPTPSPTKTKGPKGPKGKPSPTPSPSPTTCTETETRPETFGEALARYEAGDPVQINWENGGAPGGDREPTWIDTYASWPPPTVEPWRLHFTSEGKLVEEAPTDADSLSYNYKPGSSQQRGGYDVVGEPPASWDERPEEGTFLMFETDTLTADKLVAGSGSVDLWLSSTAPDTDLQVTLTEVRPDGDEVFVQQGWLRASHRKEDPELSTELRPFQTHLAADVQPLVPTEATPMRVEIFPFAHPFRAGSTIRLYVEAPHVKPDLWGFALLPVPAQNSVHIGPEQQSSLVLPVIDGSVPAEAATAPPCSITGQPVSGKPHVIRNQPCR